MRIFISRLLAPVTNSTAACAAESLILPLLAIALGYWVNPDDPLLVRDDFPWTWIAPLLIALRYGPLWGMGSAGVLLAGWFGLAPINGEQALPKLYFLGGLIFTMIAGEFASVWQMRLRRSESIQEYLDHRLDALTRTHYLLRLSHESLEQDLLSRPVSMRDALVGLRELVAGIDLHGAESLPAADNLLKLAVQFCQIERAALLPMVDGKPDLARAAFLGTEFPLDVDAPLIHHALETGLLSHVASQDADNRQDNRYLIVAPVRDTMHHTHALFIVDTLPFLALQDENLQMLNLMLGYYADSLSLAPLVTPLLARWPACPSAFALELQRLHRMQREAGVHSALVAMIFPQRGLPSDLSGALQRQQRALDVTWLVSARDGAGDARALFSILPLATSTAVDGYLARIERWADKQYGLDLEGLGIRVRTWPLDAAAPLDLLNLAMESCDDAAQADPADPAV